MDWKRTERSVGSSGCFGGLLLGGGAKLVNENRRAASATLIDSKIRDNEAKKKELSKGLGWLTNSDEIEKINQDNAELRAKKK